MRVHDRVYPSWGLDDPTHILVCNPSRDEGGQDFIYATDTSENKKSLKKKF